MNYQELEKLVIEWAKDKGILEKATPIAQAGKTLEEVNELLFAITMRDKLNINSITNESGVVFDSNHEIKDALGDILVTIIIGAELQGLKLEDCLESAYNVIKNRSGKMVNGQFVKDTPIP